MKIIRKIVKNKVYCDNKVKKDSGNNSSTEIPIIIIAVKDKQNVINLSIFFILKKTINPPITVERPAIVDIRSAFIICI